MSDKHAPRAREIIQRILYVTIASVSSEGKPWNSPVYSSFDSDGNFYWISSPRSQHSRNLERSGNAALVIYDSTVPEGTGEGVYIEATVAALNDPEDVATALRSLARRSDNEQMGEHLARLIKGDFVCAYRATPKQVWVNDDEKDEQGNYLYDVRVQLPLGSLRNLGS